MIADAERRLQIARLWQRYHGQLSPHQEQGFTRKPEVRLLAGASPAAAHRAIRPHKKLALALVHLRQEASGCLAPTCGCARPSAGPTSPAAPAGHAMRLAYDGGALCECGKWHADSGTGSLTGQHAEHLSGLPSR